MSTTLRVDDMSCEGCEDIIETALEEVSGVDSVAADNEAGTVSVEGSADQEDLIDAVDYAGYSAEIADENEVSTEADEDERAAGE